MTEIASSGTRAATEERSENALEVEDLQTGFLKRAVVHNISFACPAGKITCLFGHNGAGKSSTLKAVGGLLPLYTGRVKVFGEDVSSWPVSGRVRKGVVYLPQLSTRVRRPGPERIGGRCSDLPEFGG